jgi:chromosome segregation protein
MPLRLKQLELHGYKTFATKTELSFAEGISAIVGPNGSGKSNVVDSLRWVLGEQSFGLLRGKKTEDMIFAGSELRPRAGMAQATLTFDNADGWLPIEFSEVSITRRAYRDGENEYLLNGQRVRLRDIGELLAKCGLSERTYTIIGQGLIDATLSLKSDERRALFEEAAGIGLYRNKREDALKKLEATQRNLDRILDILAEIKPRLKGLERQAQRAREHNTIRDDLHAVLKLWYGYHWYRVVEETEQRRQVAANTARELAKAQSAQESVNQNLAALRAHSNTLKAQIAAQRQRITQLNAERETLTRALAVADERQRSLAAQRASWQEEFTPLETQLAEQTERAAAALAETQRLEVEAADAHSQAQTAQAALADREKQRNLLRQREAETRAVVNRLESQMANQRARQAQLLERRERVLAQQAEQNIALAQLQQAETRARATVHEANVNLDVRHKTRVEAETAATQQAEAVRQAEAATLACGQKLNTAQADVERVRARVEVLERARAQLAGFSAGAKTLLAQQFPTRGALAELLTVPAEYETAISAALGAYLDALVVNDADLDRAITALGPNKGRAVLLPAQQMRANAQFPALVDDADFLGSAAQRVQADDSLRPTVEGLLGQALIVRHAAAAKRALEALRATANGSVVNAIVVTLDGTVFHAAGPVWAGREAAPTMLEQARERRDLAAALEDARARYKQIEAERDAAQQALKDARAALTEKQAALRQSQDEERKATVARDSAGLEAERVSHNVQLIREQMDRFTAEAAQLAQQAAAAQAELNRLTDERGKADGALQEAAQNLARFSAESLAAQLAQWQATATAATRAVKEAQSRAAELERARNTTRGLLSSRQAQVQRLENEARALADSLAESREKQAKLQSQITAAEADTHPLEAQAAALETDQANVEKGDAESRAHLAAAERLNAQAQLEFTRKNEELETMRRRIEEDFGLVAFDYGDSTVNGPTPLPLEMVEKLARMPDLPEGVEDQLNRKRGQLRRMGQINPEAEREYREVQERHDFLTTQVADLQSAQTQLREIITEMDVLMERDFRKTFDAVAAKFRDTFTRLFGGGAAKLLLTDPDHLTTTGVDIQCRLPGRRPQSLAMLSGGERSLTACALVFALLQVSPTPFCVLDEVDAMLDEANVGRYRDMLNELATMTQFIIVTHNRNTVQVADTVYGITMGADSASQAIGLKLEGEKVKPPVTKTPLPTQIIEMAEAIEKGGIARPAPVAEAMEEDGDWDENGLDPDERIEAD